MSLVKKTIKLNLKKLKNYCTKTPLVEKIGCINIL